MSSRQQTLDSLVSWSYGLLSDEEATVFRRVAVFQGAFTVADAERVVSPPVPPDVVLAALTGLVDKSLLVIDTDKRLRLLMTLRGFAEGRLAEGADEERDARQAHARVMLDLAERVTGSGAERVAWIAAVDDGRPTWRQRSRG